MRRTALPSQQRDTRGLIGFTRFERPLLRPDFLTKLKPPDDLLVQATTRNLTQARSSPVCTENLIRVDDVMESPKLAE
jgi:hypothetical protein